jgi:Fe-S oxidoreductase
MNNFDPFVLPFAIGLYTLLIIVIAKVFDWIKHLPSEDKVKLRKGLLSPRMLQVIKEIFLETLLHRRIFKVNPLLGYMHMSLAFGWLLLILAGTVESKMYGKDLLNTPWDPIFFKYFQHTTREYHSAFFNFFMDFLLLFVLSGVLLAYLKRLRSKLFGMKKTTKQIFFDRIAMSSLWLIFPLRLIAESLTAGLHNNGGFLTQNFGNLLNLLHPTEHVEYTAWWLYSISVGAFFVALPYSRYMHIPTEAVLIALRKFGIRTDKEFTNFSQIEVYSCPRCGICIDKCQLASVLSLECTTSVYFLNSIRSQKIRTDKTFNCLLCGRCMEYCPVQINTNALRNLMRKNFITNGSNFAYLKINRIPHAKVAYYAGCMTHLTPAIYRSVTSILDHAGVDYVFLDEGGGACCGRPLMTSGNFAAAQELIEHNKKLIQNSHAEILLTSCAICYKVFNEDYRLPVKVMHHSQYFLELAEAGRLHLSSMQLKAAYHDPCELGRGSGVYEEPRKLLGMAVKLVKTNGEKHSALCCGGSLNNIMLNNAERSAISKATVRELTVNHPDILVTSCPLCKKTFCKTSHIPVKDIAEVVAESLQLQHFSSCFHHTPLGHENNVI